jgi:redox-sensitive bicupin YhaK (pirin superfamily)
VSDARTAPAITVRRAAARGREDHGWLDTRHTFSFAEYYDPAHMGFRALRVINEDRVAPGAGFPPHGHRDMEIVSYVLAGALQHRDSLGTGSVIRPGDVQRMTAGTGVTHSEFNASRDEPVHFLQIWILPRRRGLEPGYEQKAFPEDEKRNAWRLLASEDGRDGSVTIHQDVRLLVTLLDAGREVRHALAPGRHAWLQVARGRVTLDGVALEAGDGAAVSEARELVLTATADAEALLFDLA